MIVLNGSIWTWRTRNDTVVDRSFEKNPFSYSYALHLNFLSKHNVFRRRNPWSILCILPFLGTLEMSKKGCWSTRNPLLLNPQPPHSYHNPEFFDIPPLSLLYSSSICRRPRLLQGSRTQVPLQLQSSACLNQTHERNIHSPPMTMLLGTWIHSLKNMQNPPFSRGFGLCSPPEWWSRGNPW